MQLAAIGSMACLVQETKYGAGRHFMDIRIDEFGQLAFWQYSTYRRFITLRGTMTFLQSPWGRFCISSEIQNGSLTYRSYAQFMAHCSSPVSA